MWPEGMQHRKPKKTDKSRIDAFLRDLEKVYSKHGLIVGACGCCGSPFVSVHGEGTDAAIEHLRSDVFVAT